MTSGNSGELLLKMGSPALAAAELQTGADAVRTKENSVTGSAEHNQAHF